MDIEEELINNEQSVRLLQIMIDIINSRTATILDETGDVNLEEARKQTVVKVRAMADWELINYKEWRKHYLIRVMESTFDNHFSY